MKVALGTIEIPEPTRKALGKKIKGSSYLKRDEARDHLLGLINRELESVAPASEEVSVSA